MPNGVSRVTNYKSRITALASIIVFAFLIGTAFPIASAQQAKKPFTVADDIRTTLFHTSGMATVNVQFSPDGNYFAVCTEHGRLDLNRVEDSLTFYRTRDVEDFLTLSDGAQRPSPVWIVSRSDKEGPIINDWRWLTDSSGVGFLERTAGGTQRLVLADLRKKMIEPLTSPTAMVKAFDIRDRQDYAYTAADPVEREKVQKERQAPAIVGTGRGLYELIFPDDPMSKGLSSHRQYLWAVVGGERFEVKANGAPLVPEGDFALSPDGQSLVTELKVPEVPASWETLYPAPASSHSPLYAWAWGGSAHQYVRIKLRTGSVQALTDAPTSTTAGWWAHGSPSWSSDGQAIVLPGTFIKSKDNAPSRPCVAIVDLSSNIRTCVETLKGHTETGVEEGYHQVVDARFAGGDKQRVIVSFYQHGDSLGTTEYQQRRDGTWQVSGSFEGGLTERNGPEVTVKQGFNEPPLLVATNKQTSRVIWDPNLQLKDVELGEASVYAYKDKEGREWKGGLYKPVNYKAGQRYPLVIQTHSFVESLFLPSGGFSTAFAARALAANGIMVLQVSDEDGCPLVTPDEGRCAVSDYEGAANQLVSEGLVDPDKIGMIGFSRTCFYVMETLTTSSSLHLKAASVNDGVMLTYLNYITWLGPGGGIAGEANSMIGAAPFGEGLQQWVKRSPGFNLDKVNAPLLIVSGEGPIGLLFNMWEPYAGLHYLHKPADLIMLNTDEHVLTNPAVRMASQGGSVDWFRFWLQDYEDSDPAKAEQYVRWRELRKLQEQNDKKSANAASPTSH